MLDLNFLQDRYVQMVKKSVHQRNLVIYGAGVYARKLHKFLLDNGLKVECFCVSSRAGNLELVEGLPVKTMADWKNEELKNILFLLGVTWPASEEIMLQIQANPYVQVLSVPSYFELLLDEMYSRPVLEITPLAGCKVNCKFCPQELFLKNYFSKSGKKEMNFAEFKRCLDKTPKELVVDFSGFVEPFLAQDAVQMILYCAEQGRQVRLFTTLRGLTFAKFKEIEDVPFSMVVLHLPDKYGFANIPVTDEYLKLLEVVTSKVKPGGRRFVDTANCQAEPDERAAAVLQGRVPISWSLIDRAGNLQNEGLASGKVLAGEACFCRRAGRLDHNVLLPNGDVVLCCMDFGMRHILGNLLRDDYDDILSSAEMKKVQKSLIGVGDSLCRYCTSAERRSILQ